MIYFKKEEFSCKCCGAYKMDAEFIELLTTAREECGFPFIIASGYRCSKHNAAVSTTGLDGPHTTGKAADIRVSGARAHKLVRIALNLGFTGIGVSQKGPHEKRFIHLDTLQPPNPRPNIWTYP
jgi:zinc D-Ala-D-Ala carboxypeptidase